jgi:hypothetical protein
VREVALEELVVGTAFLVVFGAQPHLVDHSHGLGDIRDGMQSASFLAPGDLALGWFRHFSLPSA